MVWVPKMGVKELPVTPIPLNVPPKGFPIKATDGALVQTGAYVPALTMGKGFTKKLCVLLPTHPLFAV